MADSPSVTALHQRLVHPSPTVVRHTTRTANVHLAPMDMYCRGTQDVVQNRPVVLRTITKIIASVWDAPAVIKCRMERA